MTRRALITGAAGQDGSLLAEHLAERGYDVTGIGRGDVDLLDQEAVVALLEERRPDEIYHLAAPSFVPRSWEQPVEVVEFVTRSVTILLEAVRAAAPKARFFQASTSEIFGSPRESPQTERTPLAPVTPYGAAKAYGHLIVQAYRARYGLFACSGILYNHESPRRPLDFLPRKVARGAASIALGRSSELVLGDLSAQRDWSYAGDVVEAMWLMLQQDEAGDYVVASGESHSVEELVELAFARAGLDWHDHVRVDESLVRGGTEIQGPLGDASRARRILGWRPTLSFEELVALLVDAELQSLRTQSSSLPTTITEE